MRVQFFSALQIAAMLATQIEALAIERPAAAPEAMMAASAFLGEEPTSFLQVQSDNYLAEDNDGEEDDSKK